MTRPNSVAGLRHLGKTEMTKAASGADTITYKNGNGSYFVITDIELRENEFCSRHIDYRWAKEDWHYDEPGEALRCRGYGGVIKAWSGDRRGEK